MKKIKNKRINYFLNKNMFGLFEKITLNLNGQPCIIEKIEKEEADTAYVFKSKSNEVHYFKVQQIKDTEYIFVDKFQLFLVNQDIADEYLSPFSKDLNDIDFVDDNVVSFEGVNDVLDVKNYFRFSSIGKSKNYSDLTAFLKSEGFFEKITGETELESGFLQFLNDNYDDFIYLSYYKNSDEIIEKIQKYQYIIKEKYEKYLKDRKIEIDSDLYDFFYDYKIKREDCKFI